MKDALGMSALIPGSIGIRRIASKMMPGKGQEWDGLVQVIETL